MSGSHNEKSRVGRGVLVCSLVFAHFIYYFFFKRHLFVYLPSPHRAPFHSTSLTTSHQPRAPAFPFSTRATAFYRNYINFIDAKNDFIVRRATLATQMPAEREKKPLIASNQSNDECLLIIIIMMMMMNVCRAAAVV